jgi:hypothetical protein
MRRNLLEFVDKPFDYVKSQMVCLKMIDIHSRLTCRKAAGTAQSSFVARQLQTASFSPREEHLLKWAAASFFIAGTDTVCSHVYLQKPILIFCGFIERVLDPCLLFLHGNKPRHPVQSPS